MKDIDWSKAPEGATHFHLGSDEYSPHWLKKGYFCATGFEHKGWVREVAGTPLDECVVRPVTPQWNGTGLPPVGTVCEWRDCDSGGWQKVAVLYLSQYTALLGFDTESGEDGEGAYSPRDCQFRPIRTPEQIAAEEREATIKGMVDRFALYSHPDIQWRALFAQMYDAGYRITAEDER